MSDEPTQETRPKKGDPVEIPVPSKDQIMGDFEKIATSGQAGERECGRIRIRLHGRT